MKKFLFFIILSTTICSAYSQQIDSIYFHLYTDSLKKGQHNYINVDGKSVDGRWIPLTSKELIFSCEDASFSGNEIIIPDDFNKKKIIIKAALRSNPSIIIERTIWIKQVPDPPLKTKDHRY